MVEIHRTHLKSWEKVRDFETHMRSKGRSDVR